ncbi:TetR/AcrR family transcriptional regulator [Pseudonocardia broussonetiae]|uniref:TetR family transcriptional regulator n=1 Tax=Pseudonocardia broussonetiae TaxID=2736640 RepID=A0A6M6JLS8_9PSEU|nr:TetR family transcriptional regulator [Pseudonocardia broussonetiae]QJY48020.1 TetR family transcriptional regulator [Pseudonocardia broussonetiae]
MPRWEPDGAERLETAAFDLFAEQGFDRTTVAEVAERAGLTPRTFFNHFADKREVLFGLSAEFRQRVVRGIAECPAAVPPLDAAVHALQGALDTMFEHRRAAVARRFAIVEATPELRERELGKNADLADAVEAALRARGHDPDTARFAADAASAVQRRAMQEWTGTADGPPLRELVVAGLHALRAAVAGGADAARPDTAAERGPTAAR